MPYWGAVLARYSADEQRKKGCRQPPAMTAIAHLDTVMGSGDDPERCRPRDPVLLVGEQAPSDGQSSSLDRHMLCDCSGGERASWSLQTARDALNRLVLLLGGRCRALLPLTSVEGAALKPYMRSVVCASMSRRADDVELKRLLPQTLIRTGNNEPQIIANMRRQLVRRGQSPPRQLDELGGRVPALTRAASNTPTD